MADGVSVRVDIADFTRQIAELRDDGRKVVRAGVAAASLIFRTEVQRVVPTYSGPRRKRRIAGTLARNIITKRLREPEGQEHYFVGVRAGRQRPRKGAPAASLFLPFYWRWVEAGHRIVPRGKSLQRGGRGTRRLSRERHDTGGGGRTRAVRYLANSFQTVGRKALDAFESRVAQRIAKANAQKA